jgi:antitoxin (DNA-binding transcriptional repressor) of toxin-antitoxin stability system
MREVGPFEAKNTLRRLLDLVEQGEEVIITRHGKAVAWLAPQLQARDHEQARAALRGTREHAETLQLGRFDCVEWKTFRDSGRA